MMILTFWLPCFAIAVTLTELAVVVAYTEQQLKAKYEKYKIKFKKSAGM